jgi:hypothetical protein
VAVRIRIPRLAGFACSLLLLLGLAGCGSGSRPSIAPVPALASTLAAQKAYRRIEARLVDLPPERRQELEHDLRDFLARFASDDRARLVRLYLAWIEIDRGRPREAEALVAEVRRGPPGAVRDFASVVGAAALRRQGRLAEALSLLEPLRGKISDPAQRGLQSEELVRVLALSRRFDDALRAMLDWAEQAPPAEREEVVASIEGLVRGMPTPALEAGLRLLGAAEAGEASSTRSEARLWLLATARAHLVRVALTGRDPELARRLVESAPPRLGHDDSRDALLALASTSAVAPRVAGRAIGVVLDVSDDVSRRRSAEVVEGMTRALRLPASAPEKDAVVLVTRDAAEPGDIERALAGLAGDGATLLVAGVTDEGAVAASLFAEATRLPVVVLRHPALLGARTPFTFILGPAASEEESAVAEALAAAGSRVAFRVGPGGAPCDAISVVGGTRFPVREWRRGGVDALVLLGDTPCARDAAAEMLSAGSSPLLVLGLEACDAPESIPGRKMLVTAGRFPFAAHALAPDERAWVDRWGSPPSWYETLGHDSALLAAAALLDFPTERVDDSGAVSELHRRAKDTLLRARASLWSTVAPGFGGANVIPREFRAAAPSGESAAPP